MSEKSVLANVGSYALGLALMLGLLFLGVLLIVGGVAIGERLLPWLTRLSMLCLGLNIFVLLPLALIPATRPWGGLGFFISSFIFGITAWFMGLLLTWHLWGGIAVVIGLLLFGVGVVPMGLLASLFNGLWAQFGVLLLGVVLTFGLRTVGMMLAEDV